MSASLLLRARTARLPGVGMQLAGLLVSFVLVFGLLLGEQLFSAASLRSMAFQLPELGILAFAMMIPLLSGGLDLSIIATANLSALAAAFILTSVVPAEPGLLSVLWQVAAIVGALLVGASVGLVNGLVIACLGVSPILATLGAMTFVKGLGIGLSGGNVLSGFPEAFVFLGNGSLFGIPVVLVLFAAIAVPLAVLVERSSFGHRLKMMGSNEAATRFSGVDTRLMLVKVYVLSGTLSAVAGIVMMSRFNSANASYGESYLLVTILAAVLGGVNPSGGAGKVSGLVVALVILQLISTSFNLLGLSQFLTLAIWGATLIAVAGLARLRG